MKNYSFTINGKKYEVTVEGIEGKTANVTVNGKAYQVELDSAPVSGVGSVSRSSTPIGGPSDKPSSNPAAPSPDAATPAPSPSPSAPAGNAVQVTSPLPGVIIEVSAVQGQHVKAGEKVAVLEAMKMENEITAPREGTVTAVHVAKGDSVLEGAPVVSIA